MESDRKRVSDLLRDILEKHSGERVSIKALVHDLHQQGMPLLMGLFAIPLCLPVPYPPGVSTFIAACISVFAIQFLMQRQELWIPGWIAERTMSRGLLDAFIKKALPLLLKFQHLLKPRWESMITPRVQAIASCIILAMNFIIATPVPGIHFFPGWAVIVMCFGFLYRDGKVVAIGMGVAAWGVIFGWGEIWLGAKALRALPHLLGLA